MTWSTTEIEYEEFPLLLRKPDYPNIWQFKNEFTQLVSVEHCLEQVTTNGLPEKKYNKKLADFDFYMCSLLDNTKNGIIFLVETFGGKRTYYYYTLPDFDIEPLIKKTKRQFKTILEVSSHEDKDWSFLTEYPVSIS